MQIDYKVSRTISLTFTEEQYQVLHDVLQKLYNLDLMEENVCLNVNEAMFFNNLYENLDHPNAVHEKI